MKMDESFKHKNGTKKSVVVTGKFSRIFRAEVQMQ